MPSSRFLSSANHSSLLGRSTADHHPQVARGEGCYLFDSTGKRYLDGSGGAAVSCLGHSNTDVKDAIAKQLSEVAFAHTGFFTSAPAEELGSLLVDCAPAGIARVMLLSGGSEAVEASLKLARQYYLETGQASKRLVIARHQSYHGATLGALAAGGNEWRREQFKQMMVSASYISPCYEYRGKLDGESAYDYGQRIADELEEQIIKLGAENVMAFIAEPVVGASLGAVPAVEGYFKRIRKICDRYQVMLILDEIMCGMGRTGSFFACEQDGVAPDMITIAKGLGAGYQPIGAVLLSDKIFQAIDAGSKVLRHGHTYMAHPMAAAAACAVVKTIFDQDLIARALAMGKKLDKALRDAFDDHPHVGDIRGRGLFRGLELVQDRPSKATFKVDDGIHTRVKIAAFKQGLICYPVGGTADGVRGDHVLLAPPFIIKDEQIDELVEKLQVAIDKAIDFATAL